MKLLFFYTLGLFSNFTYAGLVPDGNIIDTNGLTLKYGSAPNEEKVDVSRWNKSVVNGKEVYSYNANSKDEFILVEVIRDESTKRVIGVKYNQKGKSSPGVSEEALEYRTKDGIYRINEYIDNNGPKVKSSIDKSIVSEVMCNEIASAALSELDKCVANSVRKLPMGTWAEMAVDDIGKMYPEIASSKNEIKGAYENMFNKELSKLRTQLPQMVSMCKTFDDYKVQTVTGALRKAYRNIQDGTNKSK